MGTNLKYRIKYNIYCSSRNFFEKETIVKRCMSELHAKTKLKAYLEKKYKEEGFERVGMNSCVEEGSSFEAFDELFRDKFSKS